MQENQLFNLQTSQLHPHQKHLAMNNTERTTCKKLKSDEKEKKSRYFNNLFFKFFSELKKLVKCFAKGKEHFLVDKMFFTILIMVRGGGVFPPPENRLLERKDGYKVLPRPVLESIRAYWYIWQGALLLCHLFSLLFVKCSLKLTEKTGILFMQKKKRSLKTCNSVNREICEACFPAAFRSEQLSSSCSLWFPIRADGSRLPPVDTLGLFSLIQVFPPNRSKSYWGRRMDTHSLIF